MCVCMCVCVFSCVCVEQCVCVCVSVCFRVCVWSACDIGLCVGSIGMIAEYHLFYRALSQKRPII